MDNKLHSKKVNNNNNLFLTDRIQVSPYKN